MNLRKEKDILDSWKDSSNNIPVVTVACITYNHERYIEDAISSFLMQETDFPFEVIIHDDASTDKTAKIVKNYAEKYPNIIKTILQTENQYSKGGRIACRFIYPISRGNFVALCEGDDFWTDKEKLQIQYNLMQKNDSISLCCHTATMTTPDKKPLKKIKPLYEEGIILTERLIESPGGILATNSMFFKNIFKSGMPDYLMKAPTGDVALGHVLALHGKVYYLDRDMSVYRKGVEGSWSNRSKVSSIKINHLKKTIESLERLNEYSGRKYQSSIKKRTEKIEFDIKMILKDKSLFADRIFKEKSNMDKIKIIGRFYFPRTLLKISVIKRKLINSKLQSD
ncbi:glycosyltransferase [Salisediminibacterium beveridgei]|uniref:Glycosyltransferase 2-like domain-containing protein n=1 Tax=Salisediminibacterium beveridgei TaxID=632773 RepID=A0A1D7QRN2_9BACI|nr:glycosyltransferase [Salisediminibacterium beveridgei]AOM81662.1 hypothetical protein BBEV_0268 [Salisediminibacterium beveridgei]